MPARLAPHGGATPAGPPTPAGKDQRRDIDRKRLVIVDAHGHAFRAFWALEPMYAPDGLPTNALYGLAGLLRRLLLEDRPDYLAVAFDAPDEVRRTFRSGLYPAYKAQRPARPTELARQIPMLREVARALGLRTLEHPDFEADDIAATLVSQAEAAGVQTTILSADKDLLQLVSDRTLVWDAMRGKRYNSAAVEEKLGVTPSMVADYLALVGDASDNVPGVPGIGKKGASHLLHTFGSLAAMYRAIEGVAPREKKKLLDHREQAFLSQSLTRLRTDVPLGVELAQLAPPIAGAEDLGHDLWERLGFHSFLRERPGARSSPPSIAAREPPAAVVPRAPEPVPVATVLEIHDLGGLTELMRRARAASAIGLAFDETADAKGSAMVLGVALPSGASWRIHMQSSPRGRPIQGALFPEPDCAACLLADVAAAMESLLSDPRRVLCGCDVLATLSRLGLGSVQSAVAHPPDGASTREREADPAREALSAMVSWQAPETRPGRA